MRADPTKPILKLDPAEPGSRQPGHGNPKPSRTIGPEVQNKRLGAKLQRLQAFLGGNPQAVQANADGLAPERLLVFEVTGSVTDFSKAVAKIDGLSFAGEDLLDADELDINPQLYLVVPNLAALKQIVNLWKKWLRGDTLPKGFAPWGHLFSRLRDIRPWGPRDRVIPSDQSILAEIAENAATGELIRIECELVFRPNEGAALGDEATVNNAVTRVGGEIISRARHPQFSYHALLIDIPRQELISIVELHQNSLAGLDPILSIMPQSASAGNEGGETDPIPEVETFDVIDEPIVAIFDAVPQQSHPWISDWLIVSDPENLEEIAVGSRVHGTAMASVVIHGDKNAASEPIGRKIYFRSVMYAAAPDTFEHSQERFIEGRLIIDVMVDAVLTMRREGYGNVVVVNLSLGDVNKNYGGRVSSWARAIDYLSYNYGILFIVSSGNVGTSLQIDTYSHPDNFHAADAENRKAAIFSSLDAVKADRRILAPAESLNALTIGAWHSDRLEAVPLPDRRYQAFPNCDMPNISSALGHGHKSAVKPDILLPGGREHLVLAPTGNPASVRPNGKGTRFGGIRVAAPSSAGQPESVGAWMLGSSPAAAYATHTAHHIFESLEREYGDEFINLDNSQKAVLLKALLVHPAAWNGSDQFITATKFPVAANWDQMRREVARHLGYGFVLPEDAIHCADDRATMWAAGRLLSNQAIEFKVPIPSDFSRMSDIRSLKATLAWFSPTRPGYQTYRASKLRIIPLSSNSKSALGVSTTIEPPWTQTEAGTVIHRQWSGQAFGLLDSTGEIRLQIQREKDQGEPLDDAIPFGLAVSVSMQNNPAIYSGILNRLSVKPQSRIGLQSA